MASVGSRVVHLVLGSGIGGVSAYWLLNRKTQDNSKTASILKYGMPEASCKMLVKDDIVIWYDATRKIPLWVAEHITNDHLEGNADRKNVKFDKDPSLPEYQRATNEDYMKSGWTRGHMAAAGNHKHSQNTMASTFQLSNIVPQEYENNSGYWYMIETYCRQLVKRYKHVYVFSGPLWLPHEEKNGRFTNKFLKYQVIGSNSVAVPTHLFKLIVAETSDPARPLVSAFVVPNERVSFKTPFMSFSVSLQRLRTLTGVDLVPKIPTGYMDLCSQSSECKVDDLAGFSQFKYLRDLNQDRNVFFLNKTWDRLSKDGLDKDPILRDAYFSRLKILLFPTEQEKIIEKST